MIRKTDACQCFDQECHGRGQCGDAVAETLYRIDMIDETGTPLCEHCANDAFNSGLFSALPDIVGGNPS